MAEDIRQSERWSDLVWEDSRLTTCGGRDRYGTDQNGFAGYLTSAARLNAS